MSAPDPPPPPGAAVPAPTAAPGSPRSPRPSPPTGIPTVGPGDLPVAFMGPQGPPQRPNLGSMLFLTAFFFFMSGGNNVPQAPIQVGPDGELVHRLTQLDLAGQLVDEYKGFINGSGNWTEPTSPTLQAASLIPPQYVHEPNQAFFTNISGFYREGRLHPQPLLRHHVRSRTPFFEDVNVPDLNTTTWNETLAAELRGEFSWSSLIKWDMNIKERIPEFNFSSLAGDEHSHHRSSAVGGREPKPDWAWVKGAATLTSADDSTVEYNFYGLHYVPNGTYNMFGLPDGMRIDVRNLPTLWPDHKDVTREIILAELEKELKVQQDSLYLSEVKADDETVTKCPLLMHFSVPPLPPGVTSAAVELYESEMRNPTGIKASLPRPPSYWEGLGLGGVLVADQCGWAFGLEGGTGMNIDDFWERSINYAAYATAAQLLVLILLVRQMEVTRTPSTLAKVSLWTVVIMGVTDSWIFSAHVVVGIMSDNRTSLPMLVPGFLCLCSAIVFGPRYAVLLHRIQAPERVTSPPTPPRATTALPTINTDGATTVVTPVVDGPQPSLIGRIQNSFNDHPRLRMVVGIVVVFIFFQFAFLPPVIPFFLFLIYSFWAPQIWRNARRGNSHALDHTFVIGTAVGRLALPLYALGYEKNVFFIETSNWVWGLVVWQWLQIMMLFAQERFGPAFFLPKSVRFISSFAPIDSYNYHPLLPSPDAENPESPTTVDERVCSICMEEVDTHPGPSGEVLLGINPRRGYALAPCHHLFHTKCLSQWLAIKTICPLCKRNLPPL